MVCVKVFVEGINYCVSIFDSQMSLVCSQYQDLLYGAVEVSYNICHSVQATSVNFRQQVGGRTYLNSYSAALDLTVGHLQPELIDTTLDSVPTCQSRCEMNITGHSKICRVNDLIGGGVGEYGFGMDASLVCKCTEAGDIVVEGNIDLDCTGNEILDRF